MFVDDFGHEVWSMVLKPGVYNVTLKKPVEVCNPDFKVINFQFTVDGLDCETIPNYFHLDKTFINNKPEEKERYKIKELMIRKCFRLMFPFNDEYFDKCIGKKGKVSIMQNKSGKLVVSYFLPNNHITKKEQDFIETTWKLHWKLHE